MPLMEQVFVGVKLGEDYPFPIVDIEATRKHASDIVWNYRKKEDVKEEGKRILKKHVSNPNRTQKSKNKTQ